jgi:hypothetical protein
MTVEAILCDVATGAVIATGYVLDDRGFIVRDLIR